MVNPEIQWSGMSQTPSKIKSILFLLSLSLYIYIYIFLDDMLNLVSDCYDDSDRTENG